jgi:hypothetical protein
MSKLSDKEQLIINIAYDTWFDAVMKHSDHELIAQHGKRLKYLVDWIGLTKIIETERKQNGLNTLA